MRNDMSYRRPIADFTHGLEYPPAIAPGLMDYTLLPSFHPNQGHRAPLLFLDGSPMMHELWVSDISSSSDCVARCSAVCDVGDCCRTQPRSCEHRH